MQRIHPDDHEMVTRAIKRVLEEGADYGEEFRIILPDGNQRWIASRGRMHADARGKPDRMLGAAIDITERKHTEEKLRQSSHAMEQSPVLIVITDTRGSIVYVNRKFTEVTGYSYSESIGQNPRFLKSGETSPELYQELWAYLTSGKTWRGEFHNRKKNGELYWEGAVVSPLLDANGRATHYVGIKEDITERRQSELEIARQRNELAHLSRVATVSELSGSLAHELNQPLGIILSNAQAAQELLLRQPPVLGEVSEILGDIVKADRRASDIIQRLRALLKRGEASLQPLPLNDLLEEVLRLVRADLIGRGVIVVCDLAPDLPPVMGDRVQLQQLALNLILNAADAMTANAPVAAG